MCFFKGLVSRNNFLIVFLTIVEFDLISVEIFSQTSVITLSWGYWTCFHKFGHWTPYNGHFEILIELLALFYCTSPSLLFVENQLQHDFNEYILSLSRGSYFVFSEFYFCFTYFTWSFMQDVSLKLAYGLWSNQHV